MSTQEPSRVFLAHGRDASRTAALVGFLRTLGLVVINPDLEPGASIQQTVTSELSSADVVVADLTESNPDVHYELGLARGLNIPTILIVDNKENVRLPEYIAGTQVIFYDDADLSSMESSVTRAVERLVG